MPIYRAILAIILCLTPHLSQASVDLEVIADGVIDPLPIETDGPDIECADIEARLQAYDQMALTHDRQVTDYLQQVSGALSQWFLALEPLKIGECRGVPAEGFNLMKNTAQQVGGRAHMAVQNSVFLSRLLTPVLPALPICLAADFAACDEISDIFIDYSGKLLLHESANNSFLGDVSLRLNSLYETMSQYDCPALQNGSLAVLPDAANKVDTLTNTAYDNAEKLAIEFDRISVSLSSCQ